jgi:glycosyltransferase involved in cell wall biosynthesis
VSGDDPIGGSPGPPTVTVVLPAWNEAEGLELAVAEALRTLGALVDRGTLCGFEVIIVDDGSTDGTDRIGQRLAEANPSVRCVSHHRNRGVGAGLRTALAVATGTYFVSTDADMPVDLAEIGPSLELLSTEGVDVVAGSRTVRRGDGSVRRIATAGYDLVIRAVFGVPVDDVNFAFKVARTDLLRSLDLRSEGPFIDAELIVLATYGGRNVRPVPMTYQPRRHGRSTTLSARTLRRLLLELVGSVARLRRHRSPGARRQRNG